MTITSRQIEHRAPGDLPPRIDHFINGSFEAAVSGEAFTTLDPTTNLPYADVARGDRNDIDRAVSSARTAFEDGHWPRLTNRARSRVLNRIADAIEAQDGRIARWESWDTGLPLTQASGQARRAAENFRFFADLMVSLHEDAFHTATHLGYVLRKPLAVAGLITPWNTPFMLESWKVAPALASGCTVVLKPAEFSPLSAQALAGAIAEADLPPGVFNVVHGYGQEAGAALVQHPDVPLISFTGETTTGQLIASSAAKRLKRLSMELGGKSPCIIFDDADLDRALDGALFGVFSLNGERCTAGSRILVQDSIYADFVKAFAARAGRVAVGLPEDPRTELGALIHPEHYAKVTDYIRIGQEEGARLVVGGGRPAGLPDGNFIEATVFAEVTPDMRIFRDEIFGPVVTLTPFRDTADAIRLANATDYGLAAYIWTTNLDRAMAVTDGVDSGMIWVNSHNVRDLRTPFGGVKMSGIGREGGKHSMEFFSEVKIAHVTISDTGVPRFGMPSGSDSPH